MFWIVLCTARNASQNFGLDPKVSFHLIQVDGVKTMVLQGRLGQVV